MPVQVYPSRGTPGTVSLDVPLPAGADPIDSAYTFVETYADLYGFDALRDELWPQAPRRPRASTSGSCSLVEFVPAAAAARNAPSAYTIRCGTFAIEVTPDFRGVGARPTARVGRCLLSFPSTVRCFVALDPVDIRGSFDALLAGHARRNRGDPLDGYLYARAGTERTPLLRRKHPSSPSLAGAVVYGVP